MNVDQVLNERGKRYGRFEDHATATQDLKRIVRSRMGGHKWDLLADDQREALEMICHKLGRIINGDPDYADSWTDIAGYAQLVSDRLERQHEDRRNNEKTGVVKTISGSDIAPSSLTGWQSKHADQA